MASQTPHHRRLWSDGRVLAAVVAAAGLSVSPPALAQEDPPDPELPYQQAFAEGATGFFTTDISIVNPHEDQTAAVRVTLLPEEGEPVQEELELAPLARTTLSANELLGGVATGVSILVESSVPVAADRAMAWGAPAYGASLETGAAAAATEWHFAEGTTAGAFHTFFLLQNPGDTAAVAVVTYFPEGAPPIVQEVPLDPMSRTTLWVNGEQPELVHNFATSITSDEPIVVERALYLNAGGQVFGAGATARGANERGTSWFFAEGATGSWFDTFLLFGNQNENEVTVTVTYLLPEGEPIERTYLVPAQSRFTVWVDADEDPRLADTSVSAVVNADQPIIAERAMWWPGPTAATWAAVHASVGSTESGTRWAVPSGFESQDRLTFVLVSNSADVPTDLQLTAIFDDGTTAEAQVPLGAAARLTLSVADVIPATMDQPFSLIIESANDVPVSVEYARYGSLDGQPISSGSNAQAVLVSPVDEGDDEEPEPTTED